MATTLTAARPRKPSKYLRRQGEIIDAAAAVFAEKGYHGASTSDIAERLGIRQGSLYYYFASKEAALDEVCHKGVEGFVQGIEAIVASGAGPADMVRAAIRNHLEPLRDRPDYVRVFLREREHLPDPSRRKIGRVSRRYERLLQGIFEAGAESGAFRADLDCRMATLALLGMLNGAALWFGRERGAGLPRVVQAFSQQVLAGLGAAPRNHGT